MEKTVECRILNKLGFHVRPTTMFTQTAATFECDVNLEFNGITANGKSALELIGLGAVQGNIIKITCSGPDAEEATAALQELVNSSFNGID